MKFKKMIAIGLATVMGMGSLAACGSEGEETESKESGGKTITIGMATSWTEMGNITEQIEEWEEKTGNTVDLQTTEDNQFKQLLSAKLVTEECFDVVLSVPGVSATFMNLEENFVDLSDQPWVERVNETTLEALSKNGKVYAAPFTGANAIGVLYNKDVFEEHGLEIPKSYEEMEEVCKTLKEAGVIPFYFGVADSWTTMQVVSANWPNIEKTEENLLERLSNNEVRWDEVPAFVEFLEVLDGYVKDGYINEDVLTANYEMQIEALATGKAAMVWHGTWMAQEIESRYPDANYGFFAAPAEDGEPLLPVGACYGVFAYKKGNNVEEAIDFINFISEKEQLEDFYAARPDISVWKDVQPEELNKANADAQVYVNNGQTGKHYHDYYVIPYDMEWDQSFQELFVGSSSAEEVASAYSDVCQKIGRQANIEAFK